MIEKISSVDKKQCPSYRDDYSQKPSFKGIGDGIISAVQMCERYPMLNVTALDLSTAIVPRTVIETKESNGYAGFEAFRRESSGLIVNCLIPSFIVMGVAKLLQRPIMGNFKKSSLVNTWANSDSIDKVHQFYGNAKGATVDERLYNTFRDQLGSISGVDGAETKDFSKLLGIQKTSDGKFVGRIGNDKVHNAVNEFVRNIKADKYDSKAFKKAYMDIVETTHIAENIKFKGDKSFFSNNLESICEDTVKMLRGVLKEDIKTSEQLTQYFKKAHKLVNWKSIGGLGLIIPLAISMQPLNRWITRKTSGQKGAPIYKDFGQTEHKELTSKQKRELLAQKFISVGSMIGVAGLSMFMDKPSLKMFQFKGLFPTMDQARIISTATFASRMAASEDKNELREATVRDIATFSSFYFLGDYVAKGIATLLEKNNNDVKLINRLKEPKEGANILQRFWNWAKYTTIKSSDELTSAKAKNLRTACQIGNIAFSLLALGVLIPLYTRSKTNKKHAEELAKTNARTSSKEFSSKDEFSKMLIKDSTAFKSFLNS